jgi:hypothetical protein
MPRISAAALGVVPAAELDFPPPAHLNAAEAAIFRDVVASSDPRHFRHEDRELLALYACHTVAACKLMKRKRRAPEQDRELRALTALIVTLSTKLRLGPKSRAPNNVRGALAGMRPRGPRPWDPPAEEAEPSAAPETPKVSVGRRWND